jgi:hypothetical protein
MMLTLTLRATLLLLLVSISAGAQSRTLAVYADAAHGLNADGKAAMRAELQRLLAPAGLDIVWKNTSERRAGEDFNLIVIASFDGSCSSAAPAMTAVATSLADTSISNGRILPFLRVDCRRVVQMLGVHAESSAVGKALGRVIAHEIYHIIARTTDHHDKGVAKAVFSPVDLTSPRFEFDMWSLSRMQPPSVAQAADAGDEAEGR